MDFLKSIGTSRIRHIRHLAIEYSCPDSSSNDPEEETLYGDQPLQFYFNSDSPGPRAPYPQTPASSRSIHFVLVKQDTRWVPWETKMDRCVSSVCHKGLPVFVPQLLAAKSWEELRESLDYDNPVSLVEEDWEEAEAED
ncbi:hypothetical protein VTK56DRAFT_4394 [Thermocarpiscus australiensis]